MQPIFPLVCLQDSLALSEYRYLIFNNSTLKISSLFPPTLFGAYLSHRKWIVVLTHSPPNIPFTPSGKLPPVSCYLGTTPYPLCRKSIPRTYLLKCELCWFIIREADSCSNANRCEHQHRPWCLGLRFVPMLALSLCLTGWLDGWIFGSVNGLWSDRHRTRG